MVRCVGAGAGTIPGTGTTTWGIVSPEISQWTVVFCPLSTVRCSLELARRTKWWQGRSIAGLGNWPSPTRIFFEGRRTSPARQPRCLVGQWMCRGHGQGPVHVPGTSDEETGRRTNRAGDVGFVCNVPGTSATLSRRPVDVPGTAGGSSPRPRHVRRGDWSTNKLCRGRWFRL